MIYDATTRPSFDYAANQALDMLARQFGKVEVLPPAETSDGTRWFVQVFPATMPVPFGAFGTTPASAATRLLKMSQTHDRT